MAKVESEFKKFRDEITAENKPDTNAGDTVGNKLAFLYAKRMQ